MSQYHRLHLVRFEPHVQGGISWGKHEVLHYPAEKYTKADAMGQAAVILGTGTKRSSISASSSVAQAETAFPPIA